MKKYIIILMAGLSLTACHNHGAHGHDHDHDHEAAEAAHQSDEIEISEARQESLGIASQTVEKLAFSSVIKTTGQILPAVGSESVVVASTSGTVSFVNGMTIGSPVRKGSAVLNLASGGLATSQQPAAAKAAFEAARNEYQRDSLLLKDNIIPQSHFEQSRLAYIQAKAAYDALASFDTAKGSVSVKSPLDGFVTGIFVNEGEYVEMGTAVLSISTSRKLNLRADVSERHAGALRNVNDASFIDASGEVHSVSAMGGKLLSYSKSAVDGYVPVTFEFNNSSSIISGQFVEVILKSAEKKDVVAVPVTSLIEEQGEYSVYVRLDEDCFMKRAVVIGESDGVVVEIREGLAPGEEVVVKGAMQVKLSSVAAAPAGHNHNH